MKISSVSITFLCAVFLVACGTTASNAGAYRPAIMQNGVNMDKYEQDRSECEQAVKQSPSNMESTNSVRFRECLAKKNYKLLG